MEIIYESAIKWLYDLGNTILTWASNFMNVIGWTTEKIGPLGGTIIEVIIGRLFFAYVVYTIVKWIIPT